MIFFYFLPLSPPLFSLCESPLTVFSYFLLQSTDSLQDFWQRSHSSSSIMRRLEDLPGFSHPPDPPHQNSSHPSPILTVITVMTGFRSHSFGSSLQMMTWALRVNSGKSVRLPLAPVRRRAMPSSVPVRPCSTRTWRRGTSFSVMDTTSYPENTILLHFKFPVRKIMKLN